MQKKYRWEAIASRLPTDRTIRGAEVGVWNGKCAEHLLRLLPNLHLTLIDRWTPPDKADSYFDSGSEIARKDNAAHLAAYLETVNRTKFAKERIDIMRNDTATAAQFYADRLFDFVFIDGDHSFAGCYRDIVAWCPKVKAGGFICGHDYDHPEQGEVKRAVLEYFGGVDGIELDANRTWFKRIVD